MDVGLVLDYGWIVVDVFVLDLFGDVILMVVVLCYVFGQYFIGVVVVIICVEDGVLWVMIINLFVLLLLDLLLIMWSLCVYLLDLLLYWFGQLFGISILVVGQIVIVCYFVDGCFWYIFLLDVIMLYVSGIVVVCDVVGYLLCMVEWMLFGGDYMMILGWVVCVEMVLGDMFVFYCGWYVYFRML